MKPEDMQALFTLSSLISMQGATLGVTVITNGLRALIGKKFSKVAIRWTAFIVSLILAFVIGWFATGDGFFKWVVAVFNAFLIFSSALGITQGLSSAGVLGDGDTKFFKSWL